MDDDGQHLGAHKLLLLLLLLCDNMSSWMSNNDLSFSVYFIPIKKKTVLVDK
jgi:hypothetical protein